MNTTVTELQLEISNLRSASKSQRRQIEALNKAIEKASEALHIILLADPYLIEAARKDSQKVSENPTVTEAIKLIQEAKLIQ